MDAAPALDYLVKDDLHSPGALGPVNMLRAFARSVGRKFVKNRVETGAMGNYARVVQIDHVQLSLTPKNRGIILENLIETATSTAKNWYQ